MIKYLVDSEARADISDIANQVGELQNSGVDTTAREQLADIAKQTNPKLENLIVNGNFSNGIARWTSSGGTAQVINNVYHLTATDKSPNMLGGNDGALVPVGHKIYARCYHTVPPECNYHRLVLRDTQLNITVKVKEIQFPKANQRNLLSGIISLEAGSPYPRLQSLFFYGTKENGMGKIAKIEKCFILDLTAAFGAGNEPTTEEMDELMAYFPDEWFEGEVDLTLMHYLLDRMKQSVKPKEMHEKQLQANKIDELTENLNIANRNLESIYRAKNGATPTSQIIDVKNIGKQKMILHLHKRANNGYDTANDVYLPNAENDFADVRIKTDGGEMLPYYVVYNGNIDIIPDKRLGMWHTGSVLTDSSKNMITNYNGSVAKSADNGFTWQTLSAIDIENPRVANVTMDDTILFAKGGILYRSESPYSSYAQVLDITTGGYTDCDITTNRIVQHPDGDLFLGAYQLERIIRIFKSTDDGLTWNLVFSLPVTYQHVHHMFVDTNQTPVVIYAGVDGGGGVFKSTDKGVTWVDLRALNPNMPYSTDFGVLYSSNKGYRLLGGETAMAGGYSIIKTTDDLNYIPVLGTGSSVGSMNGLNGKLIAGCNSSECFHNTSIVLSEDDGDSWKQIYTTQTLSTNGANDGFRYMAKDTYASSDYEQIIVGCQSYIASPLRIISDENTYYAEVIVEVPDGCTELTVESGYLCSNRIFIGNDFEISNKKIISLALNEGGQYIKESVSGKIIKGDFAYNDVGKHLFYTYPYITSAKDRKSMKLSSLADGIEVDISLANLSAFTISFWARLGFSAKFDIISSLERVGNDFLTVPNGYDLYGGETLIDKLRSPVIPDAFAKFDVVVDVTNGTITTYKNAYKRNPSTANISTLLANLTALKKARLFKVNTCSENDCIQHLNIYEGVLSQADISNSYHDYISDNQH